MALDKPDFVLGTNSWLDDGWFFTAEPPVELLTRGARDRRLTWDRYAWCLHAARRGEFDALRDLPAQIEDCRDELLAQHALDLLGDAGGPAEVDYLVKTLRTGSSARRAAAADSARFVGWPALVEPLLEAWAAVEGHDHHVIVAHALSGICERGDGGEILAMSSVYDANPEAVEAMRPRIGDARADRVLEPEATPVFRKAVETARAGLLSEFADRTSLWRGEKASPRAVVAELERLVAPERRSVARGYVALARRKLEALTGWNCGAFFEATRPQRLAIAAELEALAEEVDFDAFVPGRRYFFGHPVPD